MRAGKIKAPLCAYQNSGGKIEPKASEQEAPSRDGSYIVAIF